MTRNGTCAWLLAGLLMASLIVGCGKPGVSKSNYDKIEDGMSLAEVEKILGPGEKGASVAGTIGELVGQGAAYVWEEGDKKITVVFKDDKVVSKSQVGL